MRSHDRGPGPGVRLKGAPSRTSHRVTSKCTPSPADKATKESTPSTSVQPAGIEMDTFVSGLSEEHPVLAPGVGVADQLDFSAAQRMKGMGDDELPEPSTPSVVEGLRQLLRRKMAGNTPARATRPPADLWAPPSGVHTPGVRRALRGSPAAPGPGTAHASAAGTDQSLRDRTGTAPRSFGRRASRILSRGGLTRGTSLLERHRPHALEKSPEHVPPQVLPRP